MSGEKIDFNCLIKEEVIIDDYHTDDLEQGEGLGPEAEIKTEQPKTIFVNLDEQFHYVENFIKQENGLPDNYIGLNINNSYVLHKIMQADFGSSSFFSALSYLIFFDFDHDSFIRSRIAQHVANNWEIFKDYAIDPMKQIPYDSKECYLKEISKQTTPGLGCELLAASRLFNVKLELYVGENCSFHCGTSISSISKRLKVSPSKGLCHFDALRPVTMDQVFSDFGKKRTLSTQNLTQECPKKEFIKSVEQRLLKILFPHFRLKGDLEQKEVIISSFTWKSAEYLNHHLRNTSDLKAQNERSEKLFAVKSKSSYKSKKTKSRNLFTNEKGEQVTETMLMTELIPTERPPQERTPANTVKSLNILPMYGSESSFRTLRTEDQSKRPTERPPQEIEPANTVESLSILPTYGSKSSFRTLRTEDQSKRPTERPPQEIEPANTVDSLSILSTYGSESSFRTLRKEDESKRPPLAKSLKQHQVTRKTANICDSSIFESLLKVKDQNGKNVECAQYSSLKSLKEFKQEWHRLRQARNRLEKSEIKKLKKEFCEERKKEWMQKYHQIGAVKKETSAVERIKRKYENQRNYRERRNAEREEIQLLTKEINEEHERIWFSYRNKKADEIKKLVDSGTTVQKTVNNLPTNSARRESERNSGKFEFCDTGPVVFEKPTPKEPIPKHLIPKESTPKVAITKEKTNENKLVAIPETPISEVASPGVLITGNIILPISTEPVSPFGVSREQTQKNILIAIPAVVHVPSEPSCPGEPVVKDEIVVEEMEWPAEIKEEIQELPSNTQEENQVRPSEIQQEIQETDSRSSPVPWFSPELNFRKIKPWPHPFSRTLLTSAEIEKHRAKALAEERKSLNEYNERRSAFRKTKTEEKKITDSKCRDKRKAEVTLDAGVHTKTIEEAIAEGRQKLKEYHEIRRAKAKAAFLAL